MSDITALVTCMTDKERPFIDEAIKSILQQSLPCKVIVLLNESSKLFNDLDATYPTVRFVRTALKPPGAMRNLGLQFVDTEWVAYLDGDDVWHQRKIEKQHQFIATTGVDLVGCDYALINESSTRFAYALSHFIPAPSSWFARTETMRQCPFDESLVIAEDGHWWSKYARGGASLKTMRLPEFLLNYRVRGYSLSENSVPGNRKRKLKKIAETSWFIRRTVMVLTWLSSRLLVNSQYKATLLPRS